MIYLLRKNNLKKLTCEQIVLPYPQFLFSTLEINWVQIEGTKNTKIQSKCDEGKRFAISDK